MIGSKVHSRLIVLALLLLGSLPVIQATEFKSSQRESAQPHSRYTLIVIDNLLKQMDLSLPDEKKQDPKPTPKPNPKPEPEPKKDDEEQENKQDNDFFDDDFFNSDKSFDEIQDAMEDEFTQTSAAWDEEYEQTVKRWNEAKTQFQKVKEKHQAATINIESVANAQPKLSSPTPAPTFSIENMKPGDFYVIPGALDMPIRNQSYRGTCAAFAGVRAIETLLVQHDIKTDLSEQHFYWLSKTDCQESPCTNQKSGSWFTHGLLGSKSNKEGILTEVNCPYINIPFPKNETQTPLSNCKFEPGVRAGRIHSKLNRTQVLNALKANQPVMAGLKLTDNFYEDSLVRQANIGKYRGKTDSHAGGHAVLFVGFIRLPKNLNEGDYCAITANSWGDGWGTGGFGCLTEKWLQRNEIGYESISSVELTPAFSARYLP